MYEHSELYSTIGKKTILYTFKNLEFICKPISHYIGYIISLISRFTKMIVHLWNNGHTRALPGVQRPSSPPTSPHNKESQRNSRGQHLAPNPHTALPYHAPISRLQGSLPHSTFNPINAHWVWAYAHNRHIYCL